MVAASRDTDALRQAQAKLVPLPLPGRVEVSRAGCRGQGHGCKGRGGDGRRVEAEIRGATRVELPHFLQVIWFTDTVVSLH